MAEKNLSADAKPFIPGGGSGGSSSSGGQIGGPSAASFHPSGPAPRVPGGPQPNGPGPGGPSARSPIHPGPGHGPNMGGGGGHHGGGGNDGGGIPNLGGPTNVPMYNRGNNSQMHGGGGGGGFNGPNHPNNHPNNMGGRFGGMNGPGPNNQGFNSHHGPGGNMPPGGHGGGGHGPNSWQQDRMGHGGNMGGGRGSNMGGGHGNFGHGGPNMGGPGHHGNHHGMHGGGGGGPHMGGGPAPHHGGNLHSPNVSGPGGHGHMGPGPAAQPQEHRPLIVLMLGGICSGKSAIAQKMCDPSLNSGFMYIQNDEEMSGFVKLDGLLKQQAPGARTRGYVLDDFIIRSKEEIHYILHLLSKYRISIDNVIYLQTDDMNGALARAGLEGAPDPVKMAQHAAHYEATMAYFNHISDLVIAPQDILTKSVEKLATELVAALKGVLPGQKEKIHSQPDKLMNFANFIPDFSVFLTVKKQVTEQLGGKWSNFLTQSGGSLDYAKFVRKNHNLKKYRVSANFQGERVLVVKRGKEVMLIPENHYGVFALDVHLVPTKFQTLDDFIFDAIGVKLRGANPSEDNRIIFVNDILFADGDQDMQPSPLSHSYFERQEKVKEKLMGLQQDSIFMQRPTFAVNEIGSQLVNKEWKFPGDGLIFYPPGRYASGQDPRILTFDFPSDALVTIRVWEGAPGNMEHPTNPPPPHQGKKAQQQPPEPGWTFTGLVVDYRGDEVILEEKVQVVSDLAEKFDINDGCLLDFKRCWTNPPKPKQPVGYWKFVKRADHKAKPSLIEASQNIAEPDWTKDQMTAACTSMKPLGEFVTEQRAPASPVAPL